MSTEVQRRIRAAILEARGRELVDPVDMALQAAAVANVRPGFMYEDLSSEADRILPAGHTAFERGVMVGAAIVLNCEVSASG